VNHDWIFHRLSRFHILSVSLWFCMSPKRQSFAGHDLGIIYLFDLISLFPNFQGSGRRFFGQMILLF
jgi:hypothetical protein